MLIYRFHMFLADFIVKTCLGMALNRVKMWIMKFCGCLYKTIWVFVAIIRELLGVSVEMGDFFELVDGLFLLVVRKVGCLRVFAVITRRDVGVCSSNQHSFLKSWVFVLFA